MTSGRSDLVFSYSFLDQFDNCPEAARHLFILKDFRKSYAAVDGGIDAHKVIEKRLKEKTPLPPELAHAEPYIQTLARYGEMACEVPLAVDYLVQPVGFFGNARGEPWLRGKFDVVVKAPPRQVSKDEWVRKAIIADWKTGKVREKKDQLEIGALLLMATDRQVDEVVGFNVWLKAGQITTPPYVFRRDEMSPAWARLVAKMRTVEKMDPKETWQRRPGPLCGWCPVKTCPDYRGA